MAQLYAYFYFIKTLIPWKYNDQVYGDNFKGFKINSLRISFPKEDYFLDHICESILGNNIQNIDIGNLKPQNEYYDASLDQEVAIIGFGYVGLTLSSSCK